MSLRNSHNETLYLRERELNVGRSQLFQMFLDIEARSNILRRKMLHRRRHSLLEMASAFCDTGTGMTEMTNCSATTPTGSGSGQNART